ncbi:MAG: CBS domain-containing protein [Chloroflexota bacterium]
MQVILTHEQADFDAMAALLAAHILNERAIPVLPRRVNRNVRAFLNLYGAVLPYQEARDLPTEEIEIVTLVDTQSLITLKGMSETTHVHVIDHHKLRDELPPNWTIVIERLGATTTLLVEDIQDHNGPLSSLQATLLLLGIYEDTGSLTYSSTTPRDIRAAAFLLEQGASLKIVGQYLNPPLSEEQRDLYNRLLQNAENLHIHGQHIILACADARDMNEEISSIAHKLRDLLDPDALFLLVNTSEGIRLVARSTTERINVAAVASIFGGGGHERAAAALIRVNETNHELKPSLGEVYNRLVDQLPQLVQPAITVGKIMSRNPRVLKPDTPAQEAGRMMQRYGYEGYPVVTDGKVVGLLTRRAVDRALSHRLNLPAASLMEAGEVSVTPSAPVTHLQQLMADTGWGQVPVVDEDTRQVIGIVTRTDLLKLIGSEETTLPERKNLAERLEKALPPARLGFLKLIAHEAHRNRQPVYIVGGFVRDLLLNRPSLDFDIVVEGDAIALARALERKKGGKVTSHNRFGTAKWQIATIRETLAAELTHNQSVNPADLPDSLDFISARTEFYNYPTALPIVERGSIKLDLHRRDFTINTLALRLDGRHFATLCDYWGGMNDLRKGLVRVLHSLSFVDDPTRILRAVRFEQRFNFKIESRTRQLMDEAHDLLKQVSGDRLRHELDLILSENDPAGALNRLEELNLLQAIHPELRWSPQTAPALLNVLHDPIDPAWQLPETLGNQPLRHALAYLVWMIPFKEDAARSITERLRLNHHLQSAILAGQRLLLELPDLIHASPSRVVMRLEEAPLPTLYAIINLCPGEEICRALNTYATLWRKIHPLTDGYSLHAMGIAPGPVYRRILWALRAAWLDGKINNRDQENALLNQLIYTQSPD